MKATINKSGQDTEVSPIDGGKYYIDNDNNVYRQDEVTPVNEGSAPPEPDNTVTIIISGDSGTVRQTLEAIAQMVSLGEQHLRAIAEHLDKS